MGNSASSNLLLKDREIGEASTAQSASQNGAGESQTVEITEFSSGPKAEDEIIKQRELILQEYPELKDVLLQIGGLASAMKKYEEIDIKNETMNLAVCRLLEETISYYYEYNEKMQREMIGDEIAKSGAAISFVFYTKLLTKESTEFPLEGYKSECYEVLITVMWNYTDVSVRFGDELGRCGLLPLMLKTLQKFQNTFQESKAERLFVLGSMSLLHNCCKSSNNARYFREIQAVETVAWYAKNTTNVERMEVLAPLSAMTLAYIVEEKNNGIISADNALIKTILKLLDSALASSDRRWEGFSAVELMEGLTKLCSNVENSETIMGLDISKSIIRLLKEGDEEEQMAAAKATWVLSFSDKNKLTIKSNPELVDLLKKAAMSEKRSLKNAASGALWVLKIGRVASSVATNRPKKKQAEKSRRRMAVSLDSHKRHVSNEEFYENEQLEQLASETQLEDQASPPSPIMEEIEEEEKHNASTEVDHVMISYQWDHQKVMKRLKAQLEQRSYKVWMDIDEMGGSTLQSMAEAVEGAAVVLVCFSQKYKDSISCRTEAEYAYKCKKRIVPIRVEAQYDADGWLGAILGAKFYYDFSNLVMFDNMVISLVKELGQEGKAKKIIRVMARVANALPKVRKVADWTEADVKNWTLKHKITTFQTKHVDGRVLMFLKQLKQSAPEFFYHHLSNNHGLKNIKDLMLLSEALDQLT